MTSADAVDRLIARGVFETVDGTELRLADDFRETITEHRETLAARDADGVREAVAALTDDDRAVEALCVGSEYDPDLLSRYVSLADRDADLSPTQALALAVIVGQLEEGAPPSRGAPKAFLPVSGSDLVRLVDLCQRCIVYAWRDDCSPCETVRTDFDEIIGEDPPRDVMPLAVYGPDCARLLEEEYDVVGAPTTLFTLNGQVDARLVGVPERKTLEREIETIRERTA